MAIEPPIKVYFDTCVFLAVLLSEEEGQDSARAALEAAEQGFLRGCFSALVVAEAIGSAKLRAPQGIPKKERDHRIDAARDYFLATSFLNVDVTARAGTLAMQYAIEFQLSGPDSLHLALAKMSNCDELHTFDGGLLGVGTSIDGLAVRKPWGHPQGTFAT